MNQREEARLAKNFEKSDFYRDKLKNMGVEVIDQKNGPSGFKFMDGSSNKLPAGTKIPEAAKKRKREEAPEEKVEVASSLPPGATSKKKKKSTKKRAPKGYHRMPNGKLMKGSTHPKKKGKKRGR